MELAERFFEKTVGLDSSPFIYFIEREPKYIDFLRDFFKALYKKKFTVITSSITLLEVLVLPYKNFRYDLIEAYETILENTDGIDIIFLNNNISKSAANLRAKYKIKTPDAIQIATGIINNADYFLTNDKRLKVVEEIKILILDEIKDTILDMN